MGIIAGVAFGIAFSQVYRFSALKARGLLISSASGKDWGKRQAAQTAH